ncbi:hypothetical protein ALC152_20960 [Arcobacter sp. 15-2]|uniref:CsgG/HfaB family protein n=1 Tax=Arcobacter sp. 15-2 TaxID=3374109 RepID=UPI00399C5615
MYNYKFRSSLLSVAAIAVLCGCGGNKLDVLAYPDRIKTKVSIPDVCMPQYKSAMPTVAVIEFTNNSTFGKAQLNDTNSKFSSIKKSAAVAGVVAAPTAVGIGMVSATKIDSDSKTSNVQRDVDAKLSSSITGPLESIVVNSGGAKLFTRSDMDKIDAELKFQDSGLVDPDSAVKFGKTSGVRYIITGSIDNVEQTYRDNSKAANSVNRMTSRSDNSATKLVGALLSLGASITDGMLIETKITVKLLDVETGKIVFSKQLQDDVNIGKIRQPNYDQVVGGVKSAILSSLPALEEELSSYFAVKGYITKLKAKEQNIIAQVNVGKEYKVVEDQLFNVYEFEESEDPMTGIITCDVIETTTKLRASQQITPKTTWTTIEEGRSSFLKLGQLVQKTHEKAGLGIPKF